jgi:hypothetical protein
MQTIPAGPMAHEKRLQKAQRALLEVLAQNPDRAFTPLSEESLRSYESLERRGWAVSEGAGFRVTEAGIERLAQSEHTGRPRLPGQSERLFKLSEACGGRSHMAEKLGVEESTVGKWMNGLSSPKTRAIQKNLHDLLEQYGLPSEGAVEELEGLRKRA